MREPVSLLFTFSLFSFCWYKAEATTKYIQGCRQRHRAGSGKPWLLETGSYMELAAQNLGVMRLQGARGQKGGSDAVLAMVAFTGTKGPSQYPRARWVMLSGQTEQLIMLFLSWTEQDPARGLPLLPPAPLLVLHTPGRAGRSGARLRAPRLLGAWDRQRFIRGIGFNRGITCWSSPAVVVLVPAHPNTGLTPCLVRRSLRNGKREGTNLPVCAWHHHAATQGR